MAHYNEERLCQDFNFETHLTPANYEAANRWSVSEDSIYSGFIPVQHDPDEPAGFLVKTPFFLDNLLWRAFKSLQLCLVSCFTIIENC